MIEKILNAKKIAIFGWPASGKSTLGNFLSQKINIKLYSLDIIRWKYSENEIKDENKFLYEYEEILKKDTWIIEGNALDWIDSRLKQSDILIFLILQLINVLKIIIIGNSRCYQVKRKDYILIHLKQQVIL